MTLQISVELDDIQSAINTVTRIAPPEQGNINFEVNKEGHLELTTVSQVSRCTAMVASSVSGKGDFAVAVEALKAAIKGRQKIELTYDNSTLKVKSGQYKVDLVTTDAIPPDDMRQSETKDWKLDPETSEWLRASIKTVMLRPTEILSSWMPVGVKITENGAFVCCYDIQHMNWVQSKKVKGDFETVLPIDTLATVLDVFGKSKFQMKQGNNFITVRNKMVNAQLSIPVMDDIPTLDQVKDKAKAVKEMKGSAFVFDKADFLVFLDNARAVVSKERPELQVKFDEGIKLLVKTGLGTAKTKIKGKGKGQFKVDYTYLQELVSKSEDKVELTVVDGAFIAVNLKQSTALVALNQ